MDSSPSKRPPYYRQLILTLWQEQGHTPAERSPWRISLQNPHTEERTGFLDPEELVAFLYAWMQEQTRPPAQ